MSTFHHARERVRPIATFIKKSRPEETHGARYSRSALMQCPKHQVNYVLRRTTRKTPELLIYDCPEADCFITLQISAK